jgi:hypothetical protein
MLTRYRTAVVILILSCFLLVPTVSFQATPPVTFETKGIISNNIYRLRASGTSIVDGIGNKVVLVGATVDFNEYSTGFLSIEDLQKMKSYGGNCIEIHILRFEYLMPERNIINEQYFVDKLDKWVSWCEQMQVYCIVNLQHFKWSSSFGRGMPDWMLDGHGYGSPPYGEETNDRAFIDFLDVYNPLQDDNRESFKHLWSFIASRYKSNQFVLFGIMNEPLCGVPLNVTQSSYLGVTYSKFMEEVVGAIRSVGADQLIFIDRPYVCSVGNWYDNLRPVNRANIVWEDHLYVSPKDDLDKWKWIIDNGMIKKFVTEFQKPLYIGEYGPYPPNMTDWRNIILEQVAFLKNRCASAEVSGYSWHTWGFLEGEYYYRVCDYFNREESDYVLQTIFG